MKDRRTNTKNAYRAFLHNNNARILVPSLLLFLLSVDALKLSLRTHTPHTHTHRISDTRKCGKEGWKQGGFSFAPYILPHMLLMPAESGPDWSRNTQLIRESHCYCGQNNPPTSIHIRGIKPGIYLLSDNKILHDGNTNMAETRKHTQLLR